MDTDQGVSSGRRVAPPIETLDPEQCWDLLGQAKFGRLAVAVAGDLDIFPINFVVDGQTLVFRTAEGTKLVEMVMASKVALEADARDEATGEAWSVVVKGVPELLDRFDDIYLAQSMHIQPWIPEGKERFVRIAQTRVTGRRLHGTPQH